MTELQICLLGTFQVCWDFAPVSPSAWRSPWAPKLLRLVLVMRPDPVPLEEAIQLLGGTVTSEEIDLAVEQACRVLAPGAALKRDEAGRIHFAPGERCWIDIDTLRSHYEAGVRSASRGDMLPAILAFQEADALYQGDLLEEVQEPWVYPVRERLHQRYTEILERLAEGHAVLARYHDAVGFCHKALAHDPLRETTFQRMMTYYYYLGDLAGVREAYLACQDRLAHAGRRVSPETISLWQRLTESTSASEAEATAAASLDPDPRQENG